MAGENGRPHQAALVRALRKHPSYWSRPPVDVFSNKSRGNNIVDMDETIFDDSTTTSSDEERFGPPTGKE
jgi:maltoporin